MLSDDEIRDYVSAHPRCTYESLTRDLNITRYTLYKTLRRLKIRLPKKHGKPSRGNEEWASEHRCIPSRGYCPTLDRLTRAERLFRAVTIASGANVSSRWWPQYEVEF